MCGIAGELAWERPADLRSVTRMIEAMKHRGPDAQVIKAFGPATFGHARLSVLDLRECAGQPMLDSSRSFAIVFNGEIYNFLDLRKELEHSGAEFRTSGDTEVILEAYKAWGVEAFARFNGMFAIAIWDAVREQMVIARDRFGKKPLHYFWDGNAFVFASELRGLLMHAACPRDIDLGAVRQYLAVGYTLTDRPILHEVHRLAPAHYQTINRHGPGAAVCYWDYGNYFRVKRQRITEGAALEELDHLLRDAVQIRQIADVPLGCFLSGGIDSSLITYYLKHEVGTPRLNTFSIGFAEASFDESAEAKSIADFLGLAHHSRLVATDPRNLIEDGLSASDEPFADTSLVPTSILSAFARSAVTVCLSGDGGDEIFLGYETFVADKLLSAFERHPLKAISRAPLHLLGAAANSFPPSFGKVGLDEKIRRFTAGSKKGSRWGHYSWRINFQDEDLARMLDRDLLHLVADEHPFSTFDAHHEHVADLELLDQFAYVDAKTWLVDDILVKADRASMRHSLEVRAPFLDHRIAEFAASLPVAMKLKGLEKKLILRQLHAKHFPDRLRQRNKRGFNAPTSTWIRGALRDPFRAALDEALGTAWFNKPVVNRLWNEHIEGKRDNGQKLLCLASLGFWLSSTRSLRTQVHTTA